MRTLTERQQRLVDIALAAGSEGRHLTRQQLGEAAGFGKGEVARVTATRTLGLPHVRAALMEGIRETAQGDVADSYATLRFVARKARSTRDRVMAAREVLILAGVSGEPAYTGPAVKIEIILKDPVARAMLDGTLAWRDQQLERQKQGLSLEPHPGQRLPAPAVQMQENDQ
ncbi:hypothetical protein KPL78_07210 [Roseomonas sp. HJA6]|uniref:Uncharacterized protein n=1 Tax=Roseomonas alba TaxID=2846776 RepID=A0ABS7A5U3_9PROT|nr:hypothetical protein [Neoroseomonas alba]MBW6397626.1 hypothetical protein [Neoroseomonas alba]